MVQRLGRRTFDQAVAGSTPGLGVTSQLGQLSLPSLRGINRVPTPVAWFKAGVLLVLVCK